MMCSTCILPICLIISIFIYPIGFDALQSVFFATGTIYCTSSYLISGFGTGNTYIYHQEIIGHVFLVIMYSIINMYIIFNYFKAFTTCTYIIHLFYFIVLCTV